MSRRIASIVTAIAVVCSALMSFAITAPGAIAGAPLDPHALTSGDGTLRDQIELLTGSQTDLIYALLQTAVARFPGHFLVVPRGELFARDADGTTHDLGVLPPEPGLWSTLGDLVTAEGPSVGSAPTVYVWSISTGHRQRITLPDGSRFLSAGPQGVFYTNGTDLTLALLAGGTVDYGTQYTSRYDANLIPGADGAIASDDTNPNTGAGPVSYLPYASPGTVTRLAGGGNTPYTYCTAVDSDGVSCRGGEGAAFLPLNGGAATDVESCTGCSNAVAGNTMLWVALGSHLDSLSPGGSQVISTKRVDETLVEAYGKAIGVNSSPDDTFGTHHSVAYSATAADHVTRLFTSPLSVESAGPFVLARHRLTYVSDPQNAADPKAVTSVLSRRLTETGVHVGASGPVTIGTDHNQYVPLAVAISGNSTIYTTPGTGKDFNITIKTPQRAKTFHNVIHGWSAVLSYDLNQVALSKHWAMWTTMFGPLTVMNRTTDKRTTVVDKPYALSTALWGHYLVYNTKRGDVLRRNLDTGKVVTVYSPKTPLRISHVVVTEYGGWVGWHFGLPRGSAPIDGMRNVNKKSKIVHLPEQFYALSSFGALLRSPGSPSYPTTTELQSYNGKIKKLLPAQSFNELPLIAGHAIAWVTGAGQFELAHYPA